MSPDNKEMSTHIKLEQSTKENGKEALEMGLEPKGGLMEHAIPVSGKTTKHLVKESSPTQMVIPMRVNGLTTKQMDLACIHM